MHIPPYCVRNSSAGILLVIMFFDSSDIGGFGSSADAGVFMRKILHMMAAVSRFSPLSKKKDVDNF